VLMDNDIGQNIAVWNDSWKDSDPLSEIRMWDFYGLRQWILKYAPRYGKIVEAGCGYGRYVFYLGRLALDIDGVDFCEPLIGLVKKWKSDNGFKENFLAGNITDLPYPNETLSGYISLGVIEHFINGPGPALAEAYRILRPGGIAIISTPSVSFNVLMRHQKETLKNIVKRIIGHKIEPAPFFQYWYRPRRLRNMVKAAGMKIVNSGSADIMYAFCEMRNFTGENLRKGSFAIWCSNTFENTPVNAIGAQAVTISVKAAEVMHCFLCGRKSARYFSLSKYDLPICDACEKNGLAEHYLKKRKPKLKLPYLMDPPLKPPSRETCEFCGKAYMTDVIFEDFGFSKKACPGCLRIPGINILLSNEYVKPVWRKRNK